MKAYKGFEADMSCRGFKYEEGKEYETDNAEVCECGFHACENPLDCFAYYHLAEGSVFHEVELGGDIQRGDDDTKCAATKIRIGARVTLAGMIKAGLDFVFAKVKKSKTPAATSGYRSTAATSGDRSTAATSGDISTAATSGDLSTAATSGYRSTAATSGDRSTAATSGDRSTAATSGDFSTAATSGYRSTAATSGDFSTAATSGDRSTAATSGDLSTAEVQGKESVAVVTGRDCKARGCVGSWLVLTERNDNWHILGVEAICIDGEIYEPNVWYTLKGGCVVRAEP
jgi:hypothetical protein